ncbi:aminopeptidase N [soil metagenome]
MRTDQPITVYRKDYQPPAYWVDQVELVFDLDPACTTVTATLGVRRNADSTLLRDLVLDGESLELLSAEIDGTPARTTIGDDERLTVHDVPDAFTLRTVVRCSPSRNTTLSGLYMSSSGYFFTQCEAEGFRRITYFPDRPDVMARYRVELRADRAQFPVLLSNGNLIDQGELGDGRHYATWEDPFRKPCYLFALVAADLVCNEQRLKTASGREVLLQVWVEDGNLDKTPHAMQSLVDSIHWDETRFGLELDLDRFMIVATADFNMGAMENKGLNIFNTKYVLANPAIATDTDFANIESVVGHEYFHNWSGNRVTCRDWFQLSLKEGLTVFRDQEFSIDMLAAAASSPEAAASARAVKRIDDVRMLRSMQFPEDSGPMAHPIRPDAYQGIDNFYTATIYEKGAEVVRMQQTLVGRDGFRAGIDEYFRRHDGQAVTCDDFVAAMESANSIDLQQFRAWYSQAGTPRIRVERFHDAAARRFELTLSQFTPGSPGQSTKQPFHVPVSVGLVGPNGRDLPLRLAGEAQATGTTRVLSLREPRQTFVFEDIDVVPVPSVLRDFSAPVRLEHDLTDAECAFLLAHDSDAFNRWEAGQQLLMRSLLTHINAGTLPQTTPAAIVKAFRTLLASKLDPAFVDVVLALPDETFIAEQLNIVDPVAVSRARTALAGCIGRDLDAEWRSLHARLASDAPYSPDALSAGRRALRNRALSYLVDGAAADSLELARAQYRDAGNMTDRFSALTLLANAGEASDELADFYERFEDEPLVIDKWFALQATARRVPGGGREHFVEHVVGLLKHAAFTLRNPNRARSVILQFCMNNPAHFHAADGLGYELWAEYTLKLDQLNPQVASRLARCMDRWRRYTPDRQSRMQSALERVAGKPGLSKETSEIVTKALA